MVGIVVCHVPFEVQSLTLRLKTVCRRLRRRRRREGWQQSLKRKCLMAQLVSIGSLLALHHKPRTNMGMRRYGKPCEIWGTCSWLQSSIDRYALRCCFFECTELWCLPMKKILTQLGMNTSAGHQWCWRWRARLKWPCKLSFWIGGTRCSRRRCYWNQLCNVCLWINTLSQQDRIRLGQRAVDCGRRTQFQLLFVLSQLWMAVKE